LSEPTISILFKKDPQSLTILGVAIKNARAKFEAGVEKEFVRLVSPDEITPPPQNSGRRLISTSNPSTWLEILLRAWKLMESLMRRPHTLKGK
jgi:hypothetical protein